MYSGLPSNLGYTPHHLSVAVLVSATELLLCLDAQQSEMITSDYNLHISFKGAVEKLFEGKI